MSDPILRPQATVAQTMHKAQQLLEQSQVVSAELVLRGLVERQPAVIEAWLLLADLAEQRGDAERAHECLLQASSRAPQDDALTLAVAQKQLQADLPADAVDTLAVVLGRSPNSVIAWLMLGDAFDQAGRHRLGSMARLQGVQRGQASGQLLNRETTPLILQPVIEEVIAGINRQRRAMIDDALERARALVGPSDIARVAHAMAAHLGQVQDRPRSAHQRPQFLYFPGLPEGPFHDPALQPWAGKLSAAFEAVRADAVAGLALGSDGQCAAQDQFFFHRGRLIEAGHQRFAAISSLLDEITLFEVAGQAPGVRLAVLQPGSRSTPQYGVMNTRLSMQLPLVVPAGCALKVHGAAEHAWKEGEPVMFDDTFLHEWSNPSARACVVLRLDCWNPHLSSGERVATRHLIETIGAHATFPLAELRQIAQAMRSEEPA